MKTSNTAYIIYNRKAIDEFCAQWKFKPILRQLLKELIYKANFEEKPFEGKTIKRGQLVSSTRSLSDLLGRSEQEIKTAAKQLTTNKQLTTQTTNKYTLYTLCNYEEFVLSDEHKEGEGNNQLTNNHSGQQQQVNNKNNKIINNITCVRVDADIPEPEPEDILPEPPRDELRPDGNYTVPSKIVMQKFYEATGIDPGMLSKRETYENLNAVTSRLRTITKSGKSVHYASDFCVEVISAAKYAKEQHGASVTAVDLFATNAKFSQFSKYAAKIDGGKFKPPSKFGEKKQTPVKPRFPSCRVCRLQRSDIENELCGSCR